LCGPISEKFQTKFFGWFCLERKGDWKWGLEAGSYFCPCIDGRGGAFRETACVD
jgi:hypothetical protein